MAEDVSARSRLFIQWHTRTHTMLSAWLIKALCCIRENPSHHRQQPPSPVLFFAHTHSRSLGRLHMRWVILLGLTFAAADLHSQIKGNLFNRAPSVMSTSRCALDTFKVCNLFINICTRRALVIFSQVRSMRVFRRGGALSWRLLFDKKYTCSENSISSLEVQPDWENVYSWVKIREKNRIMSFLKYFSPYVNVSLFWDQFTFLLLTSVFLICPLYLWRNFSSQN